jgi:hypothetical protein
MLKYNRNYILEVERDDHQIQTILFPFTVQFATHRAALATSNSANIRIYNLSQDVRKSIFKAPFDWDELRHIKLQAGYGNNLATLLDGNIMTASSYREEGSTDFITEIECYDFSRVFTTLESNWVLDTPIPLPKSVIIDKLAKDIETEGVVRGYTSNFDGEYSKPYTVNGSTWKALKDETSSLCFIDNGTLHILKDEDSFKGEVEVIDSSSGLLSTPKMYGAWVTIEMLFEPAIRVGQQILLNSQSESLYNGIYKVVGVQHQGIISGSLNGKCKTRLELYSGKFALSLLDDTHNINVEKLA